jgi:hypothetical protein
VTLRRENPPPLRIGWHLKQQVWGKKAPGYAETVIGWLRGRR